MHFDNNIIHFAFLKKIKYQSKAQEKSLIFLFMKEEKSLNVSVKFSF